MRRDGRHDLLDLMGVARIDDGDVRHAPEDRDVLRGLMARPIAGREARQGAHDLHVEVFLGDRHADEVVGPSRRKHRIGRREWHEAFPRHSGGGADQELFRHAHLVEAVGMGLGEDVQVSVLREVRRQSHDLRPGLGQRRKGVAERSGLGARVGSLSHGGEGWGEGGNHLIKT